MTRHLAILDRQEAPRLCAPTRTTEPLYVGKGRESGSYSGSNVAVGVDAIDDRSRAFIATLEGFTGAESKCLRTPVASVSGARRCAESTGNISRRWHPGTKIRFVQSQNMTPAIPLRDTLKPPSDLGAKEPMSFGERSGLRMAWLANAVDWSRFLAMKHQGVPEC